MMYCCSNWLGGKKQESERNVRGWVIFLTQLCSCPLFPQQFLINMIINIIHAQSEICSKTANYPVHQRREKSCLLLFVAFTCHFRIWRQRVTLETLQAFDQSNVFQFLISFFSQIFHHLFFTFSNVFGDLIPFIHLIRVM